MTVPDETLEIISKAKSYLLRAPTMRPWYGHLLQDFEALSMDQRREFLLLAALRWSAFLVLPEFRARLVKAIESVDWESIEAFLIEKKPRPQSMRVISRALANLIQNCDKHKAAKVFDQIISIVGRISADLNGHRHPITPNFAFFTMELYEICTSMHDIKYEHDDRMKFAREMSEFYCSKYLIETK
jgi:hypothetical protein